MSKNFYRFWLLNHQGLYIFDLKLDNRIVLTKSEEDDLIAEIFREPAIVEAEDTPIFSRDLPSSFTRLHFRKHRKDLYILLADELIDVTEVGMKLQTWVKIRNQQRELLQGLVISAFDDIEGPKVVYERSNLSSDESLLLAVQGQTVSALGRSTDYSIGFREPLNVPNREDLQHLSYHCLQPAPDSTDPRIAKMGRMTVIYLLFQSNFPYVKEDHFLTFVEGFLDEWVYNWNAQKEKHGVYPPEIFDELLEDLRSTISVAIDLTTHEDREVANLKKLVMDLLTQNKVLQSDIRRLREKIKLLEKKSR